MRTVKRMGPGLVLLALLLSIARPAAAQEAPPDTTDGPWFFYQGRDYGSESLVHPLRLIVNGGLGILQFDNRSDRLSDIRFAHGADNAWMNLSHPIEAIEADGWGTFFRREIIPVSFNTGDAQYWPNYTLHLIGGGMSYRMIEEWYRWHGYAKPHLWSGATLTVYHLLNEVVENSANVGWSTDPIADLYLFDPLGVWLFSHDGVSGFFANTLHLRDWSHQPTIDPTHGTIVNQGQNFSIQWGLPWSERWSVFYYFGTHGEGGLSYRRADGHAISLAAGVRAAELVDISSTTRTVDLATSAGLFWDREGSLLAAVLWSGTRENQLRANVYPGVLRWGAFSPGVFLSLDRQGTATVGMDLRLVKHLPLGLARTAER